MRQPHHLDASLPIRRLRLGARAHAVGSDVLVAARRGSRFDARDAAPTGSSKRPVCAKCTGATIGGATARRRERARRRQPRRVLERWGVALVGEAGTDQLGSARLCWQSRRDDAHAIHFIPLSIARRHGARASGRGADIRVLRRAIERAEAIRVEHLARGGWRGGSNRVHTGRVDPVAASLAAKQGSVGYLQMSGHGKSRDSR